MDGKIMLQSQQKLDRFVDASAAIMSRPTTSTHLSEQIQLRTKAYSASNSP